MGMDETAANRFDDLTLGYGRRPGLHRLPGAIGRGSLIAVVGPNGAGKSPLLKGIVGTLQPLAGRIERARGLGDRLAYLPQAADLDRSFPLAVYDLVAMGLWSRSGLFGGIGRRERHRIEEAIAAVGLSGFERRTISTLSGGQMQRALFARLLLQDAGIILLDEPFTAIDAKTTADLLDVVRRWHAEARTVVAVLHHIDLVRRVFPGPLLIAREPIAWGAPASVLRPENLLEAGRMMEAHDPPGRVCAG